MKMPAVEILREMLSYDGETGTLTWRVSRRGAKAGSKAGSANSRGYIKIGFMRQCMYAHRVAWAIHYGRMPSVIDHINGNPSDNRIGNLRECTLSENQQNKASDRNSMSGVLGVSRLRSGAWFAQIGHLGRKFYLGSFDNKEDAHAAYLKAKAKLHTFNPVPRVGL